MKKQFTFLVLPLLSLASCGGGGTETKVLSVNDTMRASSYRVTWNGTRTKTYPEEYSAYNTTEKLSSSKEYGFDSDGVRAARTVSSSSSTTYFEDSDGTIYTERITPSNEVEKTTITNYGMMMKFGKYYGSPFDYLGDDDIKDGVIPQEKAYYLFNSFTGISHPVESAKYTLNAENKITNIEFSFYTLPVGISTSDGTIETCDYDMTGSLSFDYDIAKFEHLSAFSEKSSKYEEAVAKVGNNYTIKTASNGLTYPIATYVTEDMVYQHLDANVDNPISNDLLYIKKGSTYRTYMYNGKEWNRQESIDIAAILPDLAGVSPYLFEEKSDTHLSMHSEAAAYAAEKMLLSYTAVTSGTGLKAEVYLNDGYIGSVNMTFYYYGSNIVINNDYSDYGSTSIPSWLELPE